MYHTAPLKMYEDSKVQHWWTLRTHTTTDGCLRSLGAAKVVKEHTVYVCVQGDIYITCQLIMIMISDTLTCKTLLEHW